MRNRLPGLVAAVLLLIFGLPASAADDELGYVSDQELKAEIIEREKDIQRTRARLAELLSMEEAAVSELADARKRSGEIENHTAARVRAFYQMSRNAGSLRFLLEAASPVEAIRRLNLLRRILMDGLDARRSAGLRVAEAEKNLSRLSADKEAARVMLDLLSEAYQSRVREASKRRLSVRRIR